MIFIKGGNYMNLEEIAGMLGKSRQTVLDRANKLKIKPLKLGRLYTRYHISDVRKIYKSYGKEF
jgi:hypothetical protein